LIPSVGGIGSVGSGLSSGGLGFDLLFCIDTGESDLCCCLSLLSPTIVVILSFSLPLAGGPDVDSEALAMACVRVVEDDVGGG